MRTPRLSVPVLALLLTLPLATPVHAQVPTTPPRDQWYAANDEGHFTAGQDIVRIDEACAGLAEAEAVACSLQAFQDREFVVIAFIDSGVNAYHTEFRAPEFVHDPATYIQGYPAGTPALELSLDLADDEGYEAARKADLNTWGEVRRNKLHWIPGTRIIGGISAAAGGTGAGRQDLPVLDENGHGTGVTSVAAGRRYGANPNALIVMVEGLGDGSVAWAASQPWIDIVSNSWGPGLPGRTDIGLSQAVAGTRDSTRRGQSVLFSSGNGMRNTNSSDVFVAPLPDPCKCKIPGHNVSATAHTSGPSWMITVGAASPINGQAHWWHGIPVDVASFGSKWRAAAPFRIGYGDGSTDFGGTSNATPVTAGVLSAVILEARRILGDTIGGQRPSAAVAVAPPGHPLPAAGPLADGILTRTEAERITLTAAQPVAFDPDTLPWDYAVEPTTDAYYVQQGYGVVDAGARDRALAVVRGEAELPDRAEVDGWIAATDRARDAIWGAP